MRGGPAGGEGEGEEADEVALNDLGRDVEIPNINKLCLSRFHNKL